MADTSSNMALVMYECGCITIFNNKVNKSERGFGLLVQVQSHQRQE